jgi:hypothetical protein
VQGGTLAVNGSLNGSAVAVQNGSMLTGSGRITGNVSIDSGGTLAAGSGSGLSIMGNVTNNGTVRLTGGAAASITGTFTNNGVLDLITGSQTLPANFVNGPNGVVFYASSARILQVIKTGSDVHVTIQSLAGHNYQLQRTSSLGAPNWQNIGQAQVGTGAILTLSDADGATSSNVFYRVVIAP